MRPRKRDKGLPAYVRIRHGSYHYRGKKLCRVAEGEGAMYDALAKLKALPVLDIRTIAGAVESFKKEYLPALAASFRPTAEFFLDAFAKDFQRFTVAAVEATDVRRSIRQLYPTLPMQRAYKARVSRFFQWTVEVAGLRKVNPCREVGLPEPKAKPSKWTDELFHTVRDKLSPMLQCYHDLTVLLYQRTTDVRLLMRSQIRDGMIRVTPTKTRGSTGATLDLPITPEIQAALDRAAGLSKLQAGPGGDAPVIQRSDGTQYSRSGIYNAYRRADAALHGKAIGLNPKALRPYAGLLAQRQGYSKEQIQIGYAHALITTTEGYLKRHDTPVSPVRLTLPARAK